MVSVATNKTVPLAARLTRWGRGMQAALLPVGLGPRLVGLHGVG